MREDEGQNGQTVVLVPSNSSNQKDGSGIEGVFGKGKYKLWALGAITLLAVWTMFTGTTVTLKWSHLNLKHAPPSTLNSDLDILDVDEREKMVKQMWNVYKHSSVVKLPSFWRDAFGAAYQDLSSEVTTVRNAALREIAKMSFHSGHIFDLSPRESEEGGLRMKMGSSRKQK